MDSKFIEAIRVALILSGYLKLSHWNVRGMFFYPYHLLFEDLYGKIYTHVDTLAELASIRGVKIGSEIFDKPPEFVSGDPKSLIDQNLGILDKYRECLEELLSEVESSNTTKSTSITVETLLATLDNVQYLLEASL